MDSDVCGISCLTLQVSSGNTAHFNSSIIFAYCVPSDAHFQYLFMNRADTYVTGYECYFLMNIFKIKTTGDIEKQHN